MFFSVTTAHGIHGYPTSNKQMDPLFVAIGPSFKKCFQIPPFVNIDVYPLIGYILDLPLGPHNGSLDVLSLSLTISYTKAVIKPLAISLGELKI